MTWIIILFIAIIIFVNLGAPSEIDINYMKNMIHPFSGVDPDNYKRFVDSLSNFRNHLNDITLAQHDRDEAVDALWEIQTILDTSSNGYTIHSEIDKIQKITDKLLLDKAILNRQSFIPTYLNNMHTRKL